MISPTHPIRFFLSYNARKIVRKMQNNVTENHFSKTIEPHFPAITLNKHALPIYRNLPGVEKQLFENKRHNLKIAIKHLNHLIIKPEETFSFWHLLGNPSKQRGYLPGLVIQNGCAAVGTGGGLCQLANMIYWLALHSELSVVEKHRHRFDIFPDSDRQVPFGTGATVVYNYKDLRLKNTTQRIYQLRLTLTDQHLIGELRATEREYWVYEVIERNHRFSRKNADYFRSNEIFRLKKNTQNNVITEELIATNTCKCQYTPEDV